MCDYPTLVLALKRRRVCIRHTTTLLLLLKQKKENKKHKIKIDDEILMTEVTFEGLHTFALPLAQSTRKLLLPILIDMNLIKTVTFIEC